VCNLQQGESWLDVCYDLGLHCCPKHLIYFAAGYEILCIKISNIRKVGALHLHRHSCVAHFRASQDSRTPGMQHDFLVLC
jgi:hypothetical protein